MQSELCCCNVKQVGTLGWFLRIIDHVYRSISLYELSLKRWEFNSPNWFPINKVVTSIKFSDLYIILISLSPLTTNLSERNFMSNLGIYPNSTTRIQKGETKLWSVKILFSLTKQITKSLQTFQHVSFFKGIINCFHRSISLNELGLINNIIWAMKQNDSSLTKSAFPSKFCMVWCLTWNIW